MSDQFPPERISELRAFINKPGLSGTEGIYIAQIETSDCLDTIEIQAAHIAGLEAALKLGLEYWAHRQQRYRNRHPAWVIAARAALQPKETAA